MKISRNAVEYISNFKEEGKSYLKISVVGGGCSGLQYKMAWVENADDANDKVFKLPQFSILIDSKSYLYLKEVEIDFDGGLNGKGITYNNPAAVRSCGCGSSFST